MSQIVTKKSIIDILLQLLSYTNFEYFKSFKNSQNNCFFSNCNRTRYIFNLRFII